MSRKKKSKNHEGEIYLVNPKHVVKKKDITQYNHAKGSKSKNKRLVMIGIQRGGKRVQISEITTKATDKQIRRKQKVELSNTKLSKKSYVDTNTIGKSRLTSKNFKVGDQPLKKPIKTKANKEDLKTYKAARKDRGR